MTGTAGRKFYTYEQLRVKGRSVVLGDLKLGPTDQLGPTDFFTKKNLLVLYPK